MPLSLPDSLPADSGIRHAVRPFTGPNVCAERDPGAEAGCDLGVAQLPSACCRKSIDVVTTVLSAHLMTGTKMGLSNCYTRAASHSHSDADAHRRAVLPQPAGVPIPAADGREGLGWLPGAGGRGLLSGLPAIVGGRGTARSVARHRCTPPRTQWLAGHIVPAPDPKS